MSKEVASVKKPLTKEQLVKELSEDTLVRREVVELVLNRLEDIAVEELVNHHTFPLRGFITLTTYSVKATLAPDGKTPLPPQVRVRASLGKKISTLIRLQREDFAAKPFFVNRDNWRGALKWAQAQGPRHKEQAPFQRDEVDDFNPLLDEDD